MTIEKLTHDIIQNFGFYVKNTSEPGNLTKARPQKFAPVLAKEAWEAKQDLRLMLSKHPEWDEDLQAVVLSGTKIREVDSEEVEKDVCRLLKPATKSCLYSDAENAKRALTPDQAMFISNWVAYGDELDADRIKKFGSELFPRCFNPSKKRNRVLRDIMKHLHIWDDEAGSECQRKYAFISDAISAKKVDFKLILSIHPSAFLSMSNPKDDPRGETLVSCHSLNSDSYYYSSGCTGYATDDITLIAFTTYKSDLSPEALYSRKTSRQLFMYEPGSGILLQSRLYDAEGGTRGRSELGDTYRTMVQDCISECEGGLNLWSTRKYNHESGSVYFDTAAGFGGYSDWEYEEFAPMLSIRKDAEVDSDVCRVFFVGNYGICLGCGCRTDGEVGVICRTCNSEVVCEHCGTRVSRNQTHTAYNEDGDAILVCEGCLSEYFSFCSECNSYYPSSFCNETWNGNSVCDDCYHHLSMTQCEGCGGAIKPRDALSIDTPGSDFTMSVCPDCFRRM